MTRAVGKCEFHRARHQVDVVAGILALGGQVETLQHVEHLHQQHAARAGRGHGGDLVAAVGAPDRLAPLDFITGQVQFGDCALGRLLDLLRNRPDGQGLPAFLLNYPQRAGEVRLLQQPAQRRRGAVDRLDTTRFGKILESRGRVPHHVLVPDAHRHPVFRERDRGLDQPGPRQRAEPLVQCPHALHEPGHAHRVFALADAVGVLAVKRRAGGGGGRFARVQGHGFAAGRVVDHGKHAAAQPGTEGVCNCRCEGAGDGRVDRVAAAFQNGPPHGRGGAHRRDDHAIAAPGRLESSGESGCLAQQEAAGHKPGDNSGNLHFRHFRN
jgi:hypothetical protein